MSRQARRKNQRDAEKKVGQLFALIKENNKTRNGMTHRKNLRNIVRLQSELTDLGVIKRRNKFQIFWGRTKATLSALKQRFL